MSTVNVDGVVVDIPGVVVDAPVADVEVYRSLDARVDAAEGEGIMARWEFGRQLLAEREANGGLQLPHGRLDEICAEIKKSQREVRNRVQFADEYDTPEKVGNAVTDFGSWHAICKHLGTRGLRQSNENEWYTPEVYIEAAREVLGGIDLDPASSPAANRVVKATEFYTAEDNGLALSWHGRVWLNPPYGDLPGDFVAKLVEEHDAGNVPAAVALVNSNTTPTEWFQPLWPHTLCFVRGRINFIPANGDSKSTSTHGSVIAYLGPDPQRFAEVFSKFGAVVRRWP